MPFLESLYELDYIFSYWINLYLNPFTLKSVPGCALLCLLKKNGIFADLVFI